MKMIKINVLFYNVKYMESNSDIFIKSESLTIKIPKQNITDSELYISDSSNSLLSFISDETILCDRDSPIVDKTLYHQIEYINRRKNMTFIPIQFVNKYLTPSPLDEDLTPPPPPIEDLISSDEYSEEIIIPVLNLPILQITSDELAIPNVEQTNEDIKPKVNLFSKIGLLILSLSIIIIVSPILILIVIMYCITNCLF